MKILSIQVGKPVEVEFRGNLVSTGIFKEPIAGPVWVRKLNLDGDGQADLRVHGGEDKAVYAYSMEAYETWRKVRPHDTFSFGAVGENLSIDEFSEDSIFVGDEFEIGGAILQAVQPRQPCFKLGIKFKDPGIIKTFMEIARPGIYFKVLKEGEIQSGQDFKLIAQEKRSVSIQELFAFISGKHPSDDDLDCLLALRSLPQNLRRKFVALRESGV